MSIKISVGVSDVEADRLLLEEQRQSPIGVASSSDDELAARPAGWPLSPVLSEDDGDDSEELELPSLWAW